MRDPKKVEVLKLERPLSIAEVQRTIEEFLNSALPQSEGAEIHLHGGAGLGHIQFTFNRRIGDWNQTSGRE